ncbi:rho guanine nucleotide exchange factor 7-like isoform X3 [Acropora millepora]|uniref:rho guanine nucleotide exchange factor 7-like isoform X3 n=1 Tax=Acropora millepora TaxID=45264 RepID=UPI001CF29654|nr:rho guanine nucleotide exchange factor 7-like isoform X3 [Acropora millepora]
MGLKPRQIVSWFVALGLLEQHQDTNDLELDSFLLDILKDGSLLCRLLNRLKPSTINKIYQERVTEEQRADNITSFLRACQELQLKDDEIFCPTDLDSPESFPRVLQTLDSLENVATVYGLGKKFIQHHEVTSQDPVPQDSAEQEVSETKHLEMTDYDGGIHLVKAVFPFNGRDEDELCFEKGEILEVTKVVDGGWWEGTLNGKVGWFPSNYVKEISASPEPTTPVTPQLSSLSSNKRESARIYHNLVVQNILDTERAHVSELQALLQNYLKPLQTSNVLPAKDMKVLAGNFEEIVQFQQMFVNIMEDCAHLALPQQRMGAAYLQIAPQMKELYVMYCANHPRAVQVLTKYSDDLSVFIESKGAPAPGILTLTTSLSNPFRHLGKYPNHMKELERHLEEGHIDELDTKKAIAVFQNLTTSCHETRKRKETELEMLTGTIEGWEEEDISKQGDLILMSQFLIHGENGEVKERSFLLFPNCLIVLSVNANACGYRFEKKYGLSDLTIHSLEDSEGILNAFEIKVGGDVMKLSTNHAHEKTAWLEALLMPGQSPKLRKHSEKTTVTSPSPWVERLPGSLSERTYSASKSSPPRSDSFGSPPNSATPKNSLSTSGIHSQSSFDGSKFRSGSTSHSVATDLTLGSTPLSPQRKAHWDFTRLRPTPPLRPAYALIAKEDTSSAHRSMRGLLNPSRKKQGRSKSEIIEDERHGSTSGATRVLEEDVLILRVVEAYCTSARARQTLNSSPILPELPAHRPVSTSSFKDDGSNKRKSKKKFSRDVVGEFNCLRRRVEELQTETQSLRESLLEEQHARKKMERFIRGSLKGVIPDGRWDDMEKS